MRIVGVVTIPVRDAIVAVPVRHVVYANLDAPRPPGGLFIDEQGELGIAVDPRVPHEVQQASTVVAAWQAYQLLAPRWLN
jgi:hypothetical protein